MALSSSSKLRRSGSPSVRKSKRLVTDFSAAFADAPSSLPLPPDDTPSFYDLVSMPLDEARKVALSGMFLFPFPAQAPLPPFLTLLQFSLPISTRP
jgi:hypothetical protein